MDAFVLVRRVRSAIGQQVYYGEPVDTKGNVQTSSRTAFADRDILERINATIASIYPILDEAYLPIVKLTNPTNPVGGIVLTSRVYRNGVRARRYIKEDAVATMFSNRTADNEHPVFILENDFLQVYPSGGTVEIYVKQKPKTITWTEYSTKGTDTNINIPTSLTEFIVQSVASECRSSMASDEPQDNVILHTGSRWNLMAMNEEVTAFLPNSNILHVME